MARSYHRAPHVKNHTCVFPAYGSHLGCVTANCRMRSSVCDTLIRFCARHVLCWPAFPLVPALRSTGSAATFPADASAVDFFALFAGFTATMAGSDFSCPCIIGYGSSPSDADRRTRHTARDDGGQTRDLPGSDTILLHVM